MYRTVESSSVLSISNVKSRIVGEQDPCPVLAFIQPLSGPIYSVTSVVRVKKIRAHFNILDTSLGMNGPPTMMSICLPCRNRSSRKPIPEVTLSSVRVKNGRPGLGQSFFGIYEDTVATNGLLYRGEH